MRRGSGAVASRVILYPAIDVRGGRAVRLEQGDYERETAFDADPLDAAGRWISGGAERLHVVDLDGAREGWPVNLAQVRRIVAASGVPVQVGGGLRDADAVASILGAGADRVVLGTRAHAEPDWVGELVARHGGERIIASIDARAGRVAVAGWEQETGADPKSLVGELAARGVRRFVFTPVEVDGTLAGPGVEQLEAVAGAAGDAGASLIYSGGIGSLEHLRRLVGLGLDRLEGVIVGRALYEGRFTVAEAIEALGDG